MTAPSVNQSMEYLEGLKVKGGETILVWDLF
jgi:hypothetical protein